MKPVPTTKAEEDDLLATFRALADAMGYDPNDLIIIVKYGFYEDECVPLAWMQFLDALARRVRVEAAGGDGVPDAADGV